MSDDAQVSVSSPATPLLPWPKNACTTLLALVDWSPIPVEGSPCRLDPLDRLILGPVSL
jgi:hypothetical protein